jgi:hypothetical protein
MQKMNSEQIQSDIDLLLTFMNDDLENLGDFLDSVYYSFLIGKPDRIAIDEKLNWPEDHLHKILNICNARALVKKSIEGFGHIRLTEEGQSRAISLKHGKNRSYELGANMQISTLNVHGPAQVGNGNIQNIHNVFNQILQKIEDADATQEDKEEAKSLIKKLLEHPLVNSVVGGLSGSIVGLI